MLTYPQISKSEFTVRFCEFPWTWVDGPSVNSTLDNVIGCTESFPEVQELSLAPSFSEPENGYMEWYYPGESIDDDDSSLNGLIQPAVTASEFVTNHAITQGLTDTVLTCLSAELLPTSSPLLKLRMLHFSNTTLEMRSLLYWLANHKQLPSSSISIHLRETTVLYGLDLGLFLQALAQLNVRIFYDRNNTFHCHLHSTFAPYVKTPHLECYLINGLKVNAVRRWSKDALYSPDIEFILEPFPQFHGMAGQQKAEFSHRPDELERFIVDYAKKEFLDGQTISYSYRISLDERNNGTWEWVRQRTYLHDSTEPEEQRRGATIVPVKLIAGVPDEDGWWDYGPTTDEEIDAALWATEEFIQDAQAKKEMEDQEILQQFETEFLGLDFIEAGT